MACPPDPTRPHLRFLHIPTQVVHLNVHANAVVNHLEEIGRRNDEVLLPPLQRRAATALFLFELPAHFVRAQARRPRPAWAPGR